LGECLNTKPIGDLWPEMGKRHHISTFNFLKFAYAFDNASLCTKDEKPLLRKELAASIEVKS